MKNSNLKKKKPHAILVSLPLQGHIIPFIQLAIKLASKGFFITFINTENIHYQITKSSTTGRDSIFDETELDIEYVVVADGLPVVYDRSLNHDQWLMGVKYCYPAHVEVAIDKILRCWGDSFVSCLIGDSYLPWPPSLANKFGLVYVSFWTEAALVLDIYFHRHLLLEYGHIGPGARKDIIDYIPGVESLKPTDLTSYLQEEDLSTINHEYLFQCMDGTKGADFVLGNTMQELEIEPISAIQAHVPFYAIGPLFGPNSSKSPVPTSLWAESDCRSWLGTKPPKSVLYVSFGSYAHITREELGEIANGIKLSGVHFLWVLRPDMVSSDDPDPLPIGFKEEVSDRGLVVTWTCQSEVLSHSSIGGFLTHCGWNSILESIWCEIPLLCYPLLTDQFTSRKLVVDDLKIGYNLCEKSLAKEEVSQKIQLLFGNVTINQIKENIKRFKCIMEDAMVMEGSSQRNLSNFLEDLNVAMMRKEIEVTRI